MNITPVNNNIISNVSRAINRSGDGAYVIGAVDIFKKEFVSTQKEISDIFVSDPACDGIAGCLPKNWLSRVNGSSKTEINENVQKVFHAFRAAIKHMRSYNAPPKAYEVHRANLENKRIKEASAYLTKSLRYFGILFDESSVNFKRLKVKGNYIDRGYVLREKGKDPTLEKLFIKTFKHINPMYIDADYNGKYAETAHWLNINELNCKYISKFYWGDIKGNFIATEYETPPKFSSPIVQFKKSYKTLQEFAKDFVRQTGIEVSELISRGISPGRINSKDAFVPRSKTDILIEYLQSELDTAGLFHGDLHKDNAIIGTDEYGKAIVKIIDIGGVMKR